MVGGVVVEDGGAETPQVVLAFQPLAADVQGDVNHDCQTNHRRDAADAAQHHASHSQAAAAQPALGGVDAAQSAQADPDGGDSGEEEKERGGQPEKEAGDRPAADTEGRRRGRPFIRWTGLHSLNSSSGGTGP